MNLPVLIIMLFIYTGIMTYLAYLGNRRTRTEEDYLVAGRNAHPLIMALSYGSTFISTSSLVGFGGVSALYGFGLLWLALLNIVVGVFIAFAFLGVRVRKLSVELGASTFPTLLGKRYQSRFVTVFSGLMIFVLMPAYTSVVLIGGARFLEESLSMDFHLALWVLAILIAAYVISGGLKAVMYTDTFCAVVMLLGMVILLFAAYQSVGGVIAGHEGLTAMKNMVPPSLAEQGHQGWTAMPSLGSPLWWTLVSTMIMGVGIGVLAQPQLIMRCMTVKNKRSLNRSVMTGGVFMFFMTGAAFMIGPLTNLYFKNTQGKISMAVANNNIDSIMPIFIKEIMPEWFLYLILFTLLSAAISTIVSLFHVQGSAFSEDIIKTLGINLRVKNPLFLSRIGVFLGMFAAVVLAYLLPGNIIAQSTAFWYGLCASCFLPALIGALYWKRATRQGAIASMVAGFVVSAFGFLFLHAKEAKAFGLAKTLFGMDTLLAYPWTHVDPLFYALPIATVVFVVGSLLTNKSIKKDSKMAEELS
ncbi:sodium:solute symporter family protein [Thermoflavimicrobium dichotomicum]|uniref:Solute:Na+ symporter, SSS family n=1 Tax=Thermoflavimicrobium dichotomicum TaxID=46223 RepID=A0A1I3TK83_9BACL|nr:sodium:solute symporter family protein [Thermoflavimicrobium dichotomicum]SFJ70962.1 solute:Na+ symporter, SSS family [Thermoflavimicrobium dichotomicum]